MRLLRGEELNIDLVYADLNIAYLKKGWIYNREKVEVDEYGNKNYLLTGPFYPKNNSIGINAWINRSSRWVQSYIEKEGLPDIIHTHTYLGAMVANKLKKSRSIPYLVTEHYTGWMDRSIRASHKKMGIKALNEAVRVLAVSEALKQTLQPLLKQEVEVLPNFIDTSLFSHQPKIKIEDGDRSIKIISVGDLIARKRIDLGIKAIKQLSKSNSIKYTIVGDGNERSQLEQLTKSLGLASIITFTGKLEKEEVARQMKKNDILLHCSKLETFGLVVAEALCCGLFVISSPNQGVNMMKASPGLLISQDHSLDSIIRGLQKSLDLIRKVKVCKMKNEMSIQGCASFGVEPYINMYNKILSIDARRS